MTRFAVLVVALLASGSLVACTAADEPIDATPVTRPAGPVPTAPLTTLPPPDTRTASLPFADGKAPDPPGAPVTGGKATLSGTVYGPDGPVAGAVVRLERFVGDATDAVEVTTGADGRFTLRNAHGGRYRARAWRAPDLAQAEPALLFVAADGSTPIDLTVETLAGVLVLAEPERRQGNLGETVRLAVLVARRSVGRDGVLRGEGVPGSLVELQAGSGFGITGANPARTGPDGGIVWPLLCVAPGAGGGSLVVDGVSYPASLPACVDPTAPVTTTTAPAANPTAPTSSTTVPTTVPAAPAPVDLPVGSGITPPLPGPLPAGRYRAQGGPGCGLSYVPWTASGWASTPVVAEGATEVTFVAVVKDLKAVGATCRWVREA